MNVLIVGSGKLASELLKGHSLTTPFTVRRWSTPTSERGRSVVVHAGSGRELVDVIAYCQETNSILIELATGSKVECFSAIFPMVLCPNSNILMLKFMHMLLNSGRLFESYRIELTESHQAAKLSTPGTAVAIAHSLGLPAENIISVRDREKQMATLHIPSKHLDRHAVHSITINDGACHILLETRAYGPSPYADGVSKIVSAAATHPLENRVYAVDEFLANGWI